jgi:hypothetical protein
MNATACYTCGKEIKKGQRIVRTSPSILAQQLGDFPRVYHSRCYAKAEQEAARKLKNEGAQFLRANEVKILDDDPAQTMREVTA